METKTKPETKGSMKQPEKKESSLREEALYNTQAPMHYEKSPNRKSAEEYSKHIRNISRLGISINLNQLEILLQAHQIIKDSQFQLLEFLTAEITDLKIINLNNLDKISAANKQHGELLEIFKTVCSQRDKANLEIDNLKKEIRRLKHVKRKK
jgi:hypothetical protein